MWEDTIVEEVHAIRAQLLAQFDGDVHQYCEYVRTHPTPTAPNVPTVQAGPVDLPNTVAHVIQAPPAAGLR
jgi:hypothetical protein